MSLRRRVLLGILAVAFVLVATNVALATSFRSDLLRRTDEELTETASRPVFAPGGRGEPRRGDGPGDEALGAPLTDLYIAVADLGDGTLARFGSAIDEDQQPPQVDADELEDHLSDRSAALAPFTATSADGDTSWRLVAVRAQGGDRALVVGASLEEVEATLARLRTVQVVGTLSVLGALVAVSWWVLRLGVAPVVAMAATADRIAAGDLSQRVDHVDERTEAGRLGAAFNAMLTRIQEAFTRREASEARVRQFAADASHELRTPLTSIRGYAELWEAGGLRGDGELDDAMRRVAEEGRRMGALVEDLLLLARLDEHRPQQRERLRLDLIVGDGVRDARAVEPDRPISLEGAAVVVDGDESQLRQIVANLLTNARVHTPPGTPVSVTVTAAGGVATLTVTDRGPGMPPGAAERAFERFYRADPARARAHGGTGLGLSIVAAVAAGHGGRAWVVSAPGSGSTFTVELPAAAPPGAT